MNGGSLIETRTFLADQRAAATARARAYAMAAPGMPLTILEEEWDERVGRLTVRFGRPAMGAAVMAGGGAVVERGASPAAWRAAGWVPGPPVLLGGRRRFALRGLAVALVVALSGVTLLAAIGSGQGGTGRSADGRPMPTPRRDPVTAVSDPASLPRLEDAECRFEPPAWETVTCHDLVVLQDRSDPAAGALHLHVAVYPADSTQPQGDPVVFLTGGPGATALIDYEDFSAYPFRLERDLIVMDQRGTGSSRPSLACPETDPVDLLADGSGFRQHEALERCRERLEDDGVRLRSYSGADIADDLTELRGALGIDRWNLYGISYGSRLALTVMRDHPDGIRSVILDGAYPPQVDLYAEGALNASRAFARLFAACAADTSCARDHPDLEDRLWDLVADLDQEPLTVEQPGGDAEWQVSGAAFLSFVFDSLYYADAIPTLPAAIGEVEAGRTEALLSYLEGYAHGHDLSHDQYDISEGMHFAAQCREERPFTDRAAYQERSRFLRDDVVAHFDPGIDFMICDTWQVPPAPAIENEPVTSAIPTLLLSGEFDPITPPSWATLAAETLERSFSYTYPGGGHGAIVDLDCAYEMAAEFLERPTAAPDDACLSDLGQTPFDP